MKQIIILIIFAAVIWGLSESASYAQNYVIFGNRDGSPVYGCIDSDIEIGLWVATVDSVGFVHIPLASNDSTIVSRNAGEFFYPLTDWDDVSFLPLDPDSPLPGYTSQSILGFWDLFGGPNPPIYTEGDTVLIANYFMHTTADTTYLYELVCPFIEGWNHANGGLLFGSINGVIIPITDQTFSCLFLVDFYPGDANGDGLVNGLDVIYLISYFRGPGPSPYPMLAADANGDCIVNGLDVTYLVAYFKGGPEAFYGDCY